jgi:hypothetical protein
MESIKELPEIFSKGSKTYTQIGKNESVYLYEVSDSEPENEHIYFEVFYKRIAKGKTFSNGDTVPKRMIYPSNEAFGDWAYCIHRGNDYSTAQRIATNRFNFMTEQKRITKSA